MWDNEKAHYFLIEKSADGKQFTPIGRLSKSGKNGVAGYNFTESKKITEHTYYRVTVQLKNGLRKVSKVIALKETGGSEARLLTTLENPVTSTLAINYSTPVSEMNELIIYNSSGIKVYTTKIKTEKGTNIFHIGIENIPSNGIYFLQVSNSREVAVTRFIKQ
jgi:hypothetical protein